MANPKQRLDTNREGPFFVDSSCIDCGTCWHWDPLHFGPSGPHSHVHHQPQGAMEERQALLALQACPVAAIGAPRELLRQTPIDGFPALITQHPKGAVHYCGWASRRSFGASSWLIVRPEGNVLIDSPRWSAALARRIEALGGVSQMLLSHRDDVADHDRWARHFGCRRWIHAADADAAPEAEGRITGQAAVALDANLQLIPTPGHTAGSMVAVLGDHDQVIFSGDHLWWNPQQQALVASQRYCWWNWSEQLRSLELLLTLDGAWLLPGHGDWHHFGRGEWRQALKRTLAYHRQNQLKPQLQP